LAVAEKPPYRKAKQVTPGTRLRDEGRAVYIDCTVAGTQQLELPSGGVIPVQVEVGPNLLEDIIVVDAPASGTTATATVHVLF
jgi:hypothetical protein